MAVINLLLCSQARERSLIPKTSVLEVICSRYLMAAAMSLPVAEFVYAEAAPERGEISFKYLDYLDYQPDHDRIAIRAPSLMVMTPIAGEWSVSATVVSDTVSGASPRYHTSGITSMHDKRDGYTVSATRYREHSTHTFGLSYGSETDYIGRGASYQSNFFSDNKNTTLTLGVGFSYDNILPNHGYLNDIKSKQTLDAIIGLTQVFTMADLGQITFRHSDGSGYFSDQYKQYDMRPDGRVSNSVLFRWNHYFKESDSTLRSSYRYYQDTFNIQAHTLDFEYVKNLNNGWSVMPLARYYAQTKASFYYDADPTVQAGYDELTAALNAGKNITLDQRLSAFGAITYGGKIVKRIGRDWMLDFKFEQYEQRSHWALSKGSTGLDPFSARSFQIGARYFF